MLELKIAKPGCSDADLDALQRSAPTKWPSDHIAFLKANDGGEAASNVFGIPGNRDEIDSVYGVSEILLQKAALSDRMKPNIWPIADTHGGNFVVLVWFDDWSVGFWDHETEAVTELTRKFSEFAATVSPPLDVPKLDPSKVRSVSVSPDFASKFAKFMKKT